MADAVVGRAAQRRAVDIRAVDALPAAAVEVIEPGAGLADIAAGGAEQRHRAEDIAAQRLPLQPLAQPQQRRAFGEGARRPFDIGRRHAGLRLAPLRRAGCQQRLHLVPADAVGGEELPVDQAVALHHMQHGEGKRAVGARPHLQIEIGRLRRAMAHGIDDDAEGLRLLEPMLVGVRRAGRRVDAPEQSAGGVLDAAGIEAGAGAAVDVFQRLVPRGVADGVGLHLAGAQPVEEAHGEAAGDDGAGPGVVGMPDRGRPLRRQDSVQPSGDLAQRRIPAHRLELSFALGADRAAAAAAAAHSGSRSTPL